MKSFGFFLASLLVCFLGFSSLSFGVPLDYEKIKSAKKILIMPGTYDPVSLGHIETAEISLKASGADLVIILPTGSPVHKKPQPFEVRVQLIDAALNRHPNLTYPLDGEWAALSQGFNPFNAFYKKIREINPNVQIDLVVGQDVAESSLPYLLFLIHPDETLVVPRDHAENYHLPRNLAARNVHLMPEGPAGISSSKARSYIHHNLDLYFADRTSPEIQFKLSELSKLIAPSSIEVILGRGLYLDTLDNNHATPLSGLKNWTSRKAISMLKSIGLFENTKAMVVKLKRHKNLMTVKIGEEIFPVKKYLGSGLEADVFVIEKNGVEIAIKMARNKKGRETNKRIVNVQHWAKMKFQIDSPEILAFDPEGQWILSEYIKGPSLEAYIKTHDHLDAGVAKSVLDLHSKALAMANLSLIKLDIAPDNIVVRDGTAYLVDMGPIPVDAIMEQNGKAMLEFWEHKFAPKTPLKMPWSRTSFIVSNSCQLLFK